MKMNENELTIVTTVYNEPLSIVEPCLISLSKQENVKNIEVLFLDQSSNILFKNLCDSLDSKNIRFRYIRIPTKSLSFARNYGMKKAKNNLILFCDSDCILDSNWAHNILIILTRENVGVVGTKVVGKWLKKPSWYHDSNIIKAFYSLIDLGDHIIKVDKVVGASFGINLKRISNEAYFDESLGRQRGILLGGEETDLCKRIRNLNLNIIYTPFAIAYHQIPKERVNIRWILNRIYMGGVSRSLTKSKPNTFPFKKNLKDYLLILLIIIPYFLGLIRGK